MPSIACVAQVVGADKCSPLADEIKDYVALERLDQEKATALITRLSVLDKRVGQGTFSSLCWSPCVCVCVSGSPTWWVSPSVCGR